MIEKDCEFCWNNEVWIVRELCLNKYGQPIGIFLCSPANPWGEGKPCYWTEEEIKALQST